MKKILIAVLLLTMLTVTAISEEFDLESMTTEDLVLLHERIDEILEDRFECQLDVIYPGIYVVGKDIKAGDYLFSCTKVGIANFWIFEIFNSEEDYANRNVDHRQNLRLSGQMRLKLEDGMVLSVGEGLGTVQTISKPSWAP